MFTTTHRLHETHEPGTGPPIRPLQHLLVAIGVAEREDRPAADERVDPRGLAGSVAEQLSFGSMTRFGIPLGATANLVTNVVLTTCSGGIPYTRCANTRMKSTVPPETM